MYILIKIFVLFNLLIRNSHGFFGYTTKLEHILGNLNDRTNLSSISKDIERWMEQPVDHFESEDKRTWKMRYYENLNYWRPNGTILINIGGEWTISNTSSSAPAVVMLAKETNAAIFSSEHRFYGKSVPLNTTDVRNLQYLSSQQALADLANLIKTLKKEPKFSSAKVVVIGCSYAGNLAAWVRLKYPDIVDAAVASSAPVLAKVDFYEYLHKVVEDFVYYGNAGCIEYITKFIKKYATLLETDAGIKELKKEFGICEENDMRDRYNQYYFFDFLYDIFRARAQNGPERIQDYCKRVKQFLNTKIYQHFWNKQKRCNDFDFSNAAKSTRQKINENSWYYQKCTEFAYFQISTPNDTVFSFNLPVEYNYKMCESLYGSEFSKDRVNAGVESTNKIYGGLNPNVTKVIFVNGDMDPWSILGVIRDLSAEAPARVILDASHCSDMYSAPSFVRDYIKKWIGISTD